MTASAQAMVRLIKERFAATSWSETELARRANVSQPTVSRILSGNSSSPRLENLQKLARALRIDFAALLGGTIAEDHAVYSQDLKPGPDLQGPVPLISWVRAGNMSDAIDIYEPGFAEDWLACPFPHSGQAFCLEVRGLSMFPDYRPGEIILVEPEVEALHGDDVVVRTPAPDSMATFKRLHDTEDGCYLYAANPEFPNRIMEIPDGTEFCGVVTGSWQKRRKR